MPKGIYPRTEELKKKIIVNLRGYPITGKHQLLESIKKRVEKNKIHIKFNPNYGMKGKKHSEETKLKMSKKAREINTIKNLGEVKGENNPNWHGGISKLPYPFDFNEELKQLIRTRDNFRCKICNNLGFMVHHINYIKTDLNPDNLITLCRSCHSKTNHNRNEWMEYFKIKERL
jgi:hypothetical protein